MRHSLLKGNEGQRFVAVLNVFMGEKLLSFEFRINWFRNFDRFHGDLIYKLSLIFLDTRLSQQLLSQLELAS